MARKKKTKKINHTPKNPQKRQLQLDVIFQQFHQCYAQGDYQAAIKLALSAHRLAPQNPKPLSDAATCAIYLEQWDKAIELSEKVLARDNNNINALDALSHAHGYLGNTEATNQYGGKALRLRDKPFAELTLTQPSPTPNVDTQRLSNGKKIIAFSLYGDNSAYNEPAVMNAELQARIYPDWQCRFYIDDSVPATTIERLKAYSAEVIIVNETQRQLPGTMWRFFALDDDTVGRVIFRDADAVISEREAVVVKEWEASQQPFHLIRDAGSHTELILAGLWGAVAGAIDNISAKMHDYVSQKGDKLDRRFADQYFLRECIWSTVRENALTHSNLFDFMDAQPLPPIDTQDYTHDHIGCDEGRSNLTVDNEQADGTLLYWGLHTQLSAYISLDGEQEILPEERHICTYTATQTNGKISVSIPRRYARGFAKKLTRVSLSTQPPK